MTLAKVTGDVISEDQSATITLARKLDLGAVDTDSLELLYLEEFYNLPVQ